MYIEESFDNIFNMGYGSGNSPMAERAKEKRTFFYCKEKNPMTTKTRGGGLKAFFAAQTYLQKICYFLLQTCLQTNQHFLGGRQSLISSDDRR